MRLIDQPELRVEVSAVELTQAVLDRIDGAGEINAFITVTPELALADAARMDELRARGESAGPLHGMPLALKDNIDLAGVRCTAGSDWFRDRIAEEDAETTRRLRDAGAVIVGKTTLHEFAYGATNNNAHYGPCRNPWDLERVPGGSSGGSGAAVGADLCLGALGTDTGGSVRIPAALNGVTGMRHTYGAVSNRGVLPICASLDTVGPMARSAVDMARLSAVIVGYDRHDPYAIEPPAAARLGLESGERLDGLRVGVANAFYFDDVDPAVGANARAAADVLAELGAELVEVDVSDSEEAMLRTTLFSRAEALALHRERLEQDPGRFGARRAPAARAGLRGDRSGRGRGARLHAPLPRADDPGVRGRRHDPHPHRAVRRAEDRGLGDDRRHRSPDALLLRVEPGLAARDLAAVRPRRERAPHRRAAGRGALARWAAASRGNRVPKGHRLSPGAPAGLRRRLGLRSTSAMRVGSEGAGFLRTVLLCGAICPLSQDSGREEHRFRPPRPPATPPAPA